MDVTLPPDKTAAYKDINAGECFMTNGRAYLKGDYRLSGECVVSLTLDKGNMYYFNDDARVTRISLRVVPA